MHDMTSATDSTTVAAAPQDPAAIDIHTTAGKLADLRNRLAEAQQPVGAAAVGKQHEQGQYTARERIHLLLDEGSFDEIDALARHRSTHVGLDAMRPAGPGLLAR